jgi:hypothetical protein
VARSEAEALAEIADMRGVIVGDGANDCFGDRLLLNQVLAPVQCVAINL